jgi:hypothetical protein
MTYKGDDATYKGYTFSCEPNVDMNDYLSSVEEGSTLSIYDWRRQNVDNLIENLSILIRNYNKTSKIKCAFGISPSSHWAPSIESCPVGSERGADGGEDSSCNGYYSYSDLYADTRKWVLEEWIDYILPQNYTYLGSSQSGVPTGTYNKTVAWWSNVVSTTNVKLYMGTAAYQLSSWNTSKLVDFRELYYQMKWNQYKNYNVSGYVMFRYESLLSGTGLKAINYVNSTLWKKDALTPIYDTYTYEHLEENAKIIQIYKHSDTTYSVTFSAVEGAKAYGIFEDDNLIARSLRQEELYFTADSTHTYYLVTYGQDNKIAEKTELIDLACAYTNQAPSFISTPTIDKEYLLGSHITLSFEVNDPENDALTYSLYCYEGNTCYKLVENKTIENNTITYDYECFYTEASNLYFEVIIKDETHEITYKSTSFDLVKQLTSPDEPSDDIVIDDKEENQTPVKAKKCGKKDASIIMLTIFNALSIFTIYYIYRKEK